MNGPPPDKGASGGPEGRAWAARRVALAPPCVPAPRRACAAGALAEAACAEPAVPAAASGGLGPARYARGRRRCLIFLRRETCSAPRPPATPTPGHTHAPPHAPPGAAVDPSAAAGAGRSQLASRRPARPQKATGEPRRSSEPGSGGDPEVRRQTARGEGRDYLPARRHTWLGCTASMTRAGKDREMER